VRIEERGGGGWRVLKRLRASSRQVFMSTLGVSGTSVLEARVGSHISLPWTQR
jgi:hypothetical protein